MYSYPYHTNPRPKEMDRDTVNLPYYPWPYASNHCYPIPQSCHSCCNHFGGPYTFTSPYYPHYQPPPPPPSPFHHHGFYPPFPGAHPPYPVPPPHYSIHQPKYDYDKNTPTPTSHHCSECEKKSNIRPQEQVVEKKKSESLVPSDYPYPIMLVPPSYMNTESNANEKEKEKEKPLEYSKQGENDEIAHDQKVEVGNRFPFPIFWLPSKNNEVKKENVDEKATKNDEVECGKSGKHGVQKVIPVKQLETKEENKTENGKEEKKVSQKTSKLPPVCLRIDPLPRKKNSSRSPSPPGEKERSKRSTIEDSKAFKQQSEITEGLNDGKKVEKDIVVDAFSENGVEQSSKMEKKKRLSEYEAAVIIQSVYRGFEVRKSQPLMKLRQIADVKKQVVELRNRIDNLKPAIDNKQKLIIGETIMSLLLKLDTIQGLHPIVRDGRKSVAKELVGLQEKLDSLTFVKSETVSEETTSSIGCDVELVKNHEVEATDSQDDNGGEARGTDLEPQVELQNEENAGELNNDQIPTTTEPEPPVDDPIEHGKDQSDGNDITGVEDREINITDPVHDMKMDELVERGSGELNNDQFMTVATEQSVDDVIQEKSDQAQSESGNNVETVESDVCERYGSTEARDNNMQPRVESEVKQSMLELTGDQLAMEEEIELPLEEEKPDQKEALIFKNVDSIEDITTATVEVEMDVGTVETAELGKEEVGNRVQEELDETPMVGDIDSGSKEVLIEDREEAPLLPATGSHVSSGGDRKLMDENEKLRAAVEELMKAGSEQVSVIRELTGRVKDLEKKLSKKNRKVKRSSRRPRRSLVDEELKSCA